MANQELYMDIMEDGVISEGKLKEHFTEYQSYVNQKASDILKDKTISNDELADAFFNAVDEETVLTFEQDGKTYNLLLSRAYCEEDGVEEPSFASTYLIEVRGEHGLEDGIDFESGEEQELIEKLLELGFATN